MINKKVAFFGAEGAFTHLAALQYCEKHKKLLYIGECSKLKQDKLLKKLLKKYLKKHYF